jgi:hypothetical protein
MRTKILNTLFIIFFIGLIFNFIKGILFPYTYSSWQISEFMINYQGGFVRRGLLGEVLYYFAKNYNIDIILTIKALCAILYILVCLFFVYAFRKKSYPLYILPLGFFCGALIMGDNPVHYYWIRKDCLMIFSLILTLLICFKTNAPLFVKILVINALSIFAILNHEIFVFFSFPVFFFILFSYFKKKGDYLAFVYSTICLLPIILTTVIVTLAHGNADTAQIIWDSWAQFLPEKETLPIGDSISALGWDSIGTFITHFEFNFLSVGQYSIWAVVAWCFIFPIVYYISVNVLFVFRKNPEDFTEKHRIILSSIFLFQLLCLSPVFCILSCDFSRIFFYLLASTFAVFLIVPFYTLEKVFPKIINKSAMIINKQMDKILFPTKTNVAFLMIIIFCTSNNLDFNNGGSLLENSLIVTVLKTLSYPFLIIRDYIFI